MQQKEKEILQSKRAGGEAGNSGYKMDVRRGRKEGRVGECDAHIRSGCPAASVQNVVAHMPRLSASQRRRSHGESRVHFGDDCPLWSSLIGGGGMGHIGAEKPLSAEARELGQDSGSTRHRRQATPAA